MAIPVNKLDIYKYYIDSIILSSDRYDTPFKIDGGNIRQILISHTYDATIVPKISIDCVVPYNTYYDILSDSKTMVASFSIKSGISGTSNEYQETKIDQSVFNTKWIDCKMKIVDQGYLHTRDIAENSLDKSSNSSITSTAKENELEIKLYLYDHDKITKYRKNVSGIVNGNMNDVLYYLLSERDMDNIIISSSTDTERRDYVIPFGDLGQNLNSLNRNYGIYNTFYLFYMDLDRTYMISRGNLGKDIQFGELGIVNIYVEPYDQNSTAAAYAGCYKDEINNIYVVGTANMKIDNVDTLEDFSEGGNIITNVLGLSMAQNTVIGEYGVEKSYSIPNPKFHDQLIQSINESKRTITLSINGADLSILTPNKKYVVIPNRLYYDESYDIAGTYRLVKSDIILLHDGGKTFSPSVTMTLFRQ